MILYSHLRVANQCRTRGFTLIELSIVLVIIGLIVGGVLMGRDLILAAEVRAQISQIEKYNSAVNTFRGKFNAIPGDMALAVANQFNFATDAATCDGTTGRRDGDGLLRGSISGTNGQGMFETGLFWQDMSSTVGGNLIDGSFTGIICDVFSAAIPATGVGNYMPAAKMGSGTFVYVYQRFSANWFGLNTVKAISTGGSVTARTTLVVRQAYNIDKKIDDGMPDAGTVQAAYVASTVGTTAAPNASPADSTSCYDTATAPGTYALTVDNGNDANCALSFKFQ